MKKSFLMFAFLLCGAICFTSCSDDDNNNDYLYYAMLNGANGGVGGNGGTENEGPDAEVTAGLDTSSPDKIVLTYFMDMGAAGKATIVFTADFANGACTSCKGVTTLNGAVISEDDLTSTYEGMDYALVKEVFQELYDANVETEE